MPTAVIDIGSNSVRLVLYQVIGHHAQPIFNEKLACALGASLIHGKQLDPAAKDRVRTTITRFKQIIEVYQPRYVTAIATAAMRESEDGDEFARELSGILGHEVRVISGREEAQYSAMGVRATSWKPQGLVADLGGGSMDIARLRHGQPAKGICSIARGTLGFRDVYQTNGAEGVIEYVREKLQSHEIEPAETLYAVGGSFRAIARHQMALQHYPLRVMHDHCLSLEVIESLIRSMGALQHIMGSYYVGVPRKRQDSVYPALLVLHTLMSYCGSQQAIFSSAGVREGVLRAARGDEITHDPMLAMVQAMPEAKAQSDYTLALQEWLLAMLPCTKDERRLVTAFSHISELATAVHPEHRSIVAYERMLATMSYGMTHAQQVLMALALYYRYHPKYYGDSAEMSLLTPYEQHFAFALGKLADLAHNLSAGHAPLLKQFHLVRDAGRITVRLSGDSEIIVPPDAAKWCDGLGEMISALSNFAR